MWQQSLFDRLDVWRVVHDLGLTLDTASTPFRAFNPATGARFDLCQGGLVETTETGLMAGGLIDLVAFHFGGDYEKAVTHVIHLYGDRLRHFAPLPPMAMRNELVTQSRNARQLFCRIMQLRKNLADRPELFLCREWMRNQGLPVSSQDKCVMAAMGNELEAIVPDTFAPQTPYVLFLHQTNPWTPVGFDCVNMKTQKHEYVAIEDVACSVFGPWQAFVTGSAIAGVSELLAAQEQTLAQRPVICVRRHSKGRPLSFRFHQLDASGLTLAESLHLLSVSDNVSVTTPEGQSEPIVTHALRHIRQKQAANDLFGLNGMLTLLRGFPAVWSDQVLPCLRKDAILSKFVAQDANAADTTWQYKGMEIRETPAGYACHGKLGKRMVTNFTVRLTKTVFFPNSKDLLHYGHVTFGGLQKPLVLSRKTMLKHLDIEAECITAGTDTKTPGVPSVLDKALGPSLPYVLIQQASLLSVEEGIDRLGWSMAKDKFVTPHWQADSLAVTPLAPIFPPGRFDLTHCLSQSDVPASDGTFDRLDPAAWTVLCMVVGQIVHHYASDTGKAVRIHPASVPLVSAILRGIGVAETFDLNPNVRSGKVVMSTYAHGFPLFVRCSADYQIPLITQPCFVATEDGLLVTTAAALEDVQRAARHLLPLCVQHCLRHSAKNAVPGAPYDYADVGKMVVQAVLGRAVTTNQDLYPLLFAWLKDMPFDRVSRNFRQAEAGRISVRCRNSDAPRGKMMAELGQFSPEHVGDWNFSVSEQFKEVLDNYYGRPVTLGEASDPASGAS